MSAEERAVHPEGLAFVDFFNRLLTDGTKTCWERSILRSCKELLWVEWKNAAIISDVNLIER